MELFVLSVKCTGYKPGTITPSIKLRRNQNLFSFFGKGGEGVFLKKEIGFISGAVSIFFFLNPWINVQRVSLLLRRTGGLGLPVYYTGSSGTRNLGVGLLGRNRGVV